MKGLKCIVSLLLSITFLGLFVNYSDANAMKYTVDSFLIHPYAALTDSTTIYMTDTSGVVPHKFPFMNPLYNGSSCYINSASRVIQDGYVVYSSSVDFPISTLWPHYFYPYLDYIDSFSSYRTIPAHCHTFDRFGSLIPLTDDYLPEFYNASTPLVVSSIVNNDFLPYSFANNVINFHSQRGIGGVVTEHTFDISDLLNDEDTTSYTYYSDKIQNFKLALGFAPAEDIAANGHVDISFSVNLGDSTFNNLYSMINVFFYDTLNDGSPDISTGFHSFDIPCSSSRSGSVLNFNCFADSPYNYSVTKGFYAFELIMGTKSNLFVVPSSSDPAFSSTPTSFTFNSFTIILNNDFEDYGNNGFGDIGGSPESSPGGVSEYMDSDVSDLSNLFSFSFINPFAPVFALFSDNSGCRHIPVIAGMLHAVDDLYCPWFPSSVRTIVTPVVYFSSMMLLFGFAVRWLGSSSGNLFEDSPGDSGHLIIKKRGKK